jgi:hypothetical protein
VATPEIATLLTQRLLMAPGLMEGDELDATIAAQAKAFGALRAAMSGGSGS